jgi:hypothetical protein
MAERATRELISQLDREVGYKIDPLPRKLYRAMDLLRSSRSLRPLARKLARSLAKAASTYAEVRGELAANEEQGTGWWEWVNRDDDRVRRSHQNHPIGVGRTVRRVGTLFANGCRYPRDPLGPVGEVVECRCRTRPVLPPTGGPGEGGEGGGSGGGGGSAGDGPGGDDDRWRRELRAERASQLRVVGEAGVRDQLRRIRSQTPPRGWAPYHRRRHGGRLGAETDEEYLRLVMQHKRRPNLRYFTFLRARDRARMWYVADEETGNVLQYNESQKRDWSFFRPRDLNSFLGSGRGWWIEIKKRGPRWEFDEEW